VAMPAEAPFVLSLHEGKAAQGDGAGGGQC